jgi:site-specific DNA recombinase
MADANNKAFDAVIVESLDRISRDQADTATIYKHLTFAGVSIQTCHDGEVDAVQVGIRGLVGSMYLTDLGHKVRRGQSARLAAGKNPGGRVYGYKPVRGEPGEIQIDEAEAVIVARIFAEYADGKSTLKIARDLNNDGVPSARGGLWWANTLITSDDILGGLLRCKQYVGIRVWNRHKGVKNPHTGKTEYRPNPESEWQTAQVPQLRIVSEQLWNRVSVRLSERQKRPPGRPLETGRSRLLTGLLYCGVCGGRMMRASGNLRGPVIPCRLHHRAAQCTRNRYYKLEKVEAVVIKMIREMLKNPVAAGMFVERYVEACRKENAQLDKLHKQAQGTSNAPRPRKIASSR